MSTSRLEIHGKTSQVLTFRVAPNGGVTPQKATGSFLFVVSAPQGTKLRLQDQPFIDVATGTHLEATGGAIFEWFEVFNPSNEEITVKIYVGFARYGSNAFAVVEGPSECDGASITSINAGANHDFTGAPSGLRLHRIAIQVFNGDVNGRLEVRDSAGHRIALVFPETGVKLTGAGFFRVHNPNAGSVDVAISEIWALRPA